MRTPTMIVIALMLLLSSGAHAQELMVPESMAYAAGAYFFAYSDSTLWKSGASLAEVACASRGQAIREVESSGLYGDAVFVLYDDNRVWSVTGTPSCAEGVDLTRPDDPTVKPVEFAAAASMVPLMVAYEDGQIWYRAAGGSFHRIASLERAVSVGIVYAGAFHLAYEDGTVWWCSSAYYGGDPAVLNEIPCANRGVGIRKMEQSGPDILALYDDNQVWFIDREGDCFLAATLDRPDQPTWKPAEMTAQTGLPHLLVTYQDGQIWSYVSEGPFERLTAMERPVQPTAVRLTTWGFIKGAFR